MKRFIFLILIIFLISCSTHVVPIARDKLPPYQGPVAVFRSESEAPAGYMTIAAITHFDWGKYRRLTIEDAIPILQGKAQTQGANGIIIDSCEVVYSGIFSRGIDVKARAILIKCLPKCLPETIKGSDNVSNPLISWCAWRDLNSQPTD